MTDGRRDAGARGEQLAARYLEREGYRVVRRNYRCPLGEIDLVVEGVDGLVFVEVRTKRSPCLVPPEETIRRSKALRLIKLAEHYLAATNQEQRPWRVDVVAVELGVRDEPLRIEQFRDAISDVVAS